MLTKNWLLIIRQWLTSLGHRVYFCLIVQRNSLFFLFFSTAQNVFALLWQDHLHTPTHLTVSRSYCTNLAENSCSRSLFLLGSCQWSIDWM